MRSTNDIAEEGERNGNDGAIIRNVVDDGGQGVWVEADDVFVFFDDRQAKSATQNFGDFSKDDARLRYSRSLSTSATYESRIDALWDGAAPKLHGVRVLDRSDVLDLLGFGNQPVFLQESKVAKGKAEHNLTAEHWKKVPQWLENPAMVLDSDTVTGRLVFLAPEQLNGAPIVMVVEPAADKGGLTVNLLVNAYDKDSGRMPLRRWINEGLLRYYDKRTSPAILARSGLQLPGMAQARGRSWKILRDADLVKYRQQRPAIMSRSDGSGMALRDLQAVADRVSRGFKNLPKVHVLESPEALSEKDPAQKALRDFIREAGAWEDVEGATHEGEIYLFASGLTDEARAEHVLATHEVTHYGAARRGRQGAGCSTATRLDEQPECAQGGRCAQGAQQ